MTLLGFDHDQSVFIAFFLFAIIGFFLLMAWLDDFFAIKTAFIFCMIGLAIIVFIQFIKAFFKAYTFASFLGELSFIILPVCALIFYIRQHRIYAYEAPIENEQRVTYRGPQEAATQTRFTHPERPSSEGFEGTQADGDFEFEPPEPNDDLAKITTLIQRLKTAYNNDLDSIAIELFNEEGKDAADTLYIWSGVPGLDDESERFLLDLVGRIERMAA